MRVQLAFEQGLVAPTLEQKVQTVPAYTLLVMFINLLMFRFIYVTLSIHMPSPSHLCINSVGTTYLSSKLLASALLGPKSIGAACAKSSTVAQAAVMTARTTLRRVWRETLASLLAAGF